MNSKEMRMSQVFKKFVEDIYKEGYVFAEPYVCFETKENRTIDKPYKLSFITQETQEYIA